MYILYLRHFLITNEPLSSNNYFFSSLKARFHRDVALLGEEVALRARMTDLPSWFNFPDVERVQWINTILGILWPRIEAYADTLLRVEVGNKMLKI